ncbi:hypothetical protein LIER_24515 [Lithospermum erythrorhizon]|uniref:Uncharacterized protein n=1 Tax=Lithospermum erythrorhizon TaxID=34254 RepID=A0AAV3R2W1_LITER
MASATTRLLQLSREVIKPSTPTPLALKTYKLSRFEQAFNHNYMPLAVFYDKNSILCDGQISPVLYSSQSKTLSLYYPFAGTLEGGGNSVYCNDRGATLVEAEIKCPMNRILNNKDVSAQNVVYPSGIPWSSSFYNDSLLVIQLSHFHCGGKAVSVCLSHKIADGASLCNFIKHWASVARQSGDEKGSDFNGASLFPPTNCQPLVPPGGESKRGTTKSFVFDDSKIKQLKERAIKESGVESPTRIEVVSSLIYRNAIISSTFKPSVIIHVANLHSLTKPRVPRAIGCFNPVFHISTDEEEDISFGKLVKECRTGKENMYKKFNQMKTEESFQAVETSFREACAMTSQGRDDIKHYDFYNCSSLCNNGLAQVDFGWGKPVRASLGASLI